MNRITRSVQLYPVGALFGLGFDTATEVALLALAGRGAAAGLPWYAVLVVPLLFAAGMSLMDTLDGLLMTVAYDWAFMQPVRKIYLQPRGHRSLDRGGTVDRIDRIGVDIA
jgi:nickel/cobalt transporter (NiCoT) family protein